MVAKQLIVVVFLVGVSWAQRDGDMVYRRSGHHLALPRDMADQCIRNGGEKALNNVERAIEQVGTRYAKILQEIKEAVMLGRNPKEVFMKYCSRTPEFLGCITQLTDSFKPCYKAGDRALDNLDVVSNVGEQLLIFTCLDDGAVIMAFYARVSKCLEQPNTQMVLERCYVSLQSILPEGSNITINNVLNINFGESTCATMYEFQKCVVQELRTCDQKVANTAQLLIRNIRLSTPCKYKPNSASGLTVTILSSVMAASCLLLM